MRALTFVEIDVPLSTAADTTFRFTFPSSDGTPFDSIPALRSVSMTPGILAPGQDIGVRASINVSIADFQWPLEGSAYGNGTFWGKMRAVQPDFEGLPLRLIRGEEGEAIGAMRTEHYVIQEMSRKSGVNIVAKDILKLADGKRAQAPAPSNGRLNAGITNVATSATLTPAGIGNSEYPASGTLNIGNKEIVTFTRAADVLTLTRAQSGTTGVAHDADEVCQIVLVYTDESPADIIHDLLTTYTDINAAWLDLSAWQADIDTFIGRTYSAAIAEPTPVKLLLNELIEQVGLMLWWDAPDQELRLTSLKTSTAATIIDTDLIMNGSFGYKEQPGRRVSQIIAYFGLKTPLERIDEPQSYVAVQTSVLAAQQESIKKIFSRWIDINSRADAVFMNDQILARHASPPRKFMFALFRDGVTLPEMADLFRLRHFDLQDAAGDEETIDVVITSVEEREDSYICVAEENTVTEFGELTISGAQSNVNLFDVAGGPIEAVDVTFIFDAATIGSSLGGIAVRAGSFVAGSTITIICINSTDWQAAGGGGGSGGDAFYDLEFDTVITTQGTAGNAGALCYDADGIDTDIYLGGAIEGHTALGTLKAPGGGGGGQGGGKNVADDTSYGGGGGGGGAGRVIGNGGQEGQAINAGGGGVGADGTAGTDGDLVGNGGAGGAGGLSGTGGDAGDWGVAGSAGDAGPNGGSAGRAGGAAGKGLVKDGAVVNVYTDGNPGRFINGAGDAPDATT